MSDPASLHSTMVVVDDDPPSKDNKDDKSNQQQETSSSDNTSPKKDDDPEPANRRMPTNHYLHPTPAALHHTLATPPSYSKLERGNDNDHPKQACRICLEDDHPEDMIAPCQCKGSSKWVHRECLDEWRLHEHDRAFSKCTECLFAYHMQPKKQSLPNHHHQKTERRRRLQYSILVSRDLCLATIGLQLLIAALAGLVYLFDPNRSIPVAITGQDRPVAAYYLCGWLILLLVLGIYGSGMLCHNNCSVQDSIRTFQDNDVETPTTTATTTGSSGDRSVLYRNWRQQQRPTYDFCPGCYHSPYNNPMYIGYGNDTCGCCACCACCDDQYPGCCGSGNGGCGNMGGCDCCPNGDGGCGDNDGCMICLFVFLVVLGVVLAVIGFFVGMVLTVITCQRLVQRHVYLLHKRQLVQEFQVMDLSGYNHEEKPNTNIHHNGHHTTPILAAKTTTTAETTTTMTREEKNEISVVSSDPSAPPPPEPVVEVIHVVAATPVPSTPPLSDADAVYLQRLGLMEPTS